MEHFTTNPSKFNKLPFIHQQLSRFIRPFLLGFFLFSVGIKTSGYAQYKIETIAGNGAASFSGDGGLATAAQLNTPTGVAVDASGNVYIADANNHRIRKVDAVNGNIATIAGTGTNGFSGDGGLATAAQLNTPQGVAVDASGNVYIADADNHRIRKVDAVTGNIATIAGTGTNGFSGDGGSAITAQLNSPIRVAVDASGNIYIIDAFNVRIRKIDVGTGNIATIAGNGAFGFSGDGGPAIAAQIWSPNGVAIDASGNVYIADRDNNRIRKIDAGTGIIATIAGTGTSGFSGDGGPATAAQLNVPNGVTLDASGNIYIADRNNQRIRKIDASTGNIATIAGIGTSGFSGDGGLATTAQFDQPIEVKVDASGNIYITDGNNQAIRKITPLPEIDIKDNTNPIASGGTQVFNTTTFGTNATTTFSIENTGIAALNLTTVAASGDFSIVGTPPTTVTAGATANVNVSMDVSSAGNKTGTLTITSDDFDENTYTINLSGVVDKANQTINFGTFTTRTFGDANFTPGATTSSALGVNYTSSNTAVATISGNNVIIVGAGTTTITAIQLGDANYNAATNVAQILTVNKANQTINFNLSTNATKTLGDADFTLAAAGGASGNSVSFTSSDPGVATINGSTVTIVGAGTTIITASQMGDQNYNAAANVTQILTINIPNPPNAPASLALQQLSADSNFVLINWVDNSDNELGFYLKKSSDANNRMANTDTLPANTTQIKISSLDLQTQYFYQLVAFNSGGESLPTNTISFVLVGQDELNKQQVKLFPNPVKDAFSLVFNIGLTQPIQLRLLDMKGKLIKQLGTWQSSQLAGQFFNIQAIPKGTYLLEISTGNKKAYKRVVKL